MCIYFFKYILLNYFLTLNLLELEVFRKLHLNWKTTSSISMSLPRTSYFKYIDIWFLWYLANIFSIIIYHIILDMDMIAMERSNTSSQVFSIIFSSAEEEENEKSRLSKLFSKVFSFGTKSPYGESRMTKKGINKTATILFPIIVLCFNVTYFVLTT